MSNCAAVVRFASVCFRSRMWRQSLGIVVLLAIVGCAGAGSPTGPAPVAELDNSTLGTLGGQVLANSRPVSGTAQIVPVIEPDFFGFVAGFDQGMPGRFVTLVGDIAGTNFEPGECVDGEDMTLGFPTHCLLFGDGPGQFKRAHPGNTAFTTCYCTVGGVGNDDSVTLKISYPPAMPPQYPAGFTKFTFQDGTGALARLRGHGTLDFVSLEATFTYHFAGRP